MKAAPSRRVLGRYSGPLFNPHATTPGAGKIPEPDDDIYQAKSALELFSGDPAPIDWLVEGLIPRRRLGQIVADAYEGKSRILEHIACCLAVGSPVFGLYGVPNPGVTLISAPEDFIDLPRILTAHANALSVPIDSIKEKLYLFEEVVDLDSPRWMKALWENTERVRADLVIIDPIQDHTYRDPNLAVEIGQVFDFLRELARNTGATVFLSDHTNKRTGVHKKGHKQTGSGSGKKGKVDLSWIVEPVVNSEDALLNYDKRKGLGNKEPDRLVRTVIPDEFYGIEAVPWGKEKGQGIRKRILSVLRDASEKGNQPNSRELRAQTPGDNSSVERCRDDLEAEGFIAQEPGPKNCKFWHITEKGRKELEK